MTSMWVLRRTREPDDGPVAAGTGGGRRRPGGRGLLPSALGFPAFDDEAGRRGQQDVLDWFGRYLGPERKQG